MTYDGHRREAGADPCTCGDYRSQHNDNRFCRICGNSNAPYDGCTKFRFTRKANVAELEHWKKSQPRTR